MNPREGFSRGFLKYVTLLTEGPAAQEHLNPSDQRTLLQPQLNDLVYVVGIYWGVIYLVFECLLMHDIFGMTDSSTA